jgi:glyoxylase-like metal-dependent hydrolase (beta-lactamase superfamily II)
MQVVSLDADVIVVRSAFWQTTCTLVHRGAADAPAECFVIDSPVLPNELDALPMVLGQAGWTPTGLLCTHGDWDHLLGRMAFPDAALGCAETTGARLRARPGEAQRELREFDDEHYVERPRPLSLGQVQALPVPGRVDIGDTELELLPADGHTEDGMAIRVPWAGVVICGDYVSPVEIPMLSDGGSRDAYLATLARLRPLVEQARWVVPGHGAPIEAARATAILDEDVRYLTDWELPASRRTAAQRAIDEANRANA